MDLHVRYGRARSVVAAVAAVLALTAGCGATAPASSPPSPAPPPVVRAPDLDPEAVPPAPAGKPVLTITGRIGTTNADGALQLDRGELDRMGLLALTVDDPWAHSRIPLQGFPLRDLVALARPQEGATSLHLQALDDYQVDLQLADVRAQAIFLATRTGTGADLPVADGGPTRVVFADGLADRFSPDLWIWNIESIDVR